MLVFDPSKLTFLIYSREGQHSFPVDPTSDMLNVRCVPVDRAMDGVEGFAAIHEDGTVYNRMYFGNNCITMMSGDSLCAQLGDEEND